MRGERGKRRRRRGIRSNNEVGGRREVTREGVGGRREVDLFGRVGRGGKEGGNGSVGVREPEVGGGGGVDKEGGKEGGGGRRATEFSVFFVLFCFVFCCFFLKLEKNNKSTVFTPTQT